MNKEEFITRYGEEAYEERKRKSRERHRETHVHRTKEELIAIHGEEWYENRKRYAREHYRKNGLTKEQKLNRRKTSIKASAKYYSHPVHKLWTLIHTRALRLRTVSPDEAMTLLVKEAEECGCSELLNMDYMMERFHNNCKYGLVYGNLEILKYFYRLMQIKAAKNESFTESEIEMLQYFRSWKVSEIKPGVLQPNNDWVIDVSNLDMAYVEDMARAVRRLDLLLTEEKYTELKGLKTE